MTARDTVLGTIRRSLGVSGSESPRRQAVADRLGTHPAGLVPARGQVAPFERIALFIKMMELAAGTVDLVAEADDVPSTVAAFLRRHNLPMQVRRGDDRRLAALPWQREATLDVSTGVSDGGQLASVSHAFGAVAETGTLVLTSGADNPTTLNFLPDNHIVVVDAKDVAGDFETVWRKLRETYGAGIMPRTVNLITGPSRSADIEQTLILGAHGPRRLHVIIVGEPCSREFLCSEHRTPFCVDSCGLEQEMRMAFDRLEDGKTGAEARREERKRRLDQALDKALEDSFPGSDPVSVAQPAPTSTDKDKHIKRPKPGSSTRH